jgi:hypothetical protein
MANVGSVVLFIVSAVSSLCWLRALRTSRQHRWFAGWVTARVWSSVRGYRLRVTRRIERQWVSAWWIVDQDLWDHALVGTVVYRDTAGRHRVVAAPVDRPAFRGRPMELDGARIR